MGKEMYIGREMLMEKQTGRNEFWGGNQK